MRKKGLLALLLSASLVIGGTPYSAISSAQKAGKLQLQNQQQETEKVSVAKVEYYTGAQSDSGKEDGTSGTVSGAEQGAVLKVTGNDRFLTVKALDAGGHVLSAGRDFTLETDVQGAFDLVKGTEGENLAQVSIADSSKVIVKNKDGSEALSFGLERAKAEEKNETKILNKKEKKKSGDEDDEEEEEEESTFSKLVADAAELPAGTEKKIVKVTPTKTYEDDYDKFVKLTVGVTQKYTIAINANVSWSIYDADGYYVSASDVNVYDEDDEFTEKRIKTYYELESGKVYYFAFEIGDDTSKTYSVSVEKTIGFSDLTDSAKELNAGKIKKTIEVKPTKAYTDYYDQFIKLTVSETGQYVIAINADVSYSLFDSEGDYIYAGSDNKYDEEYEFTEKRIKTYDELESGKVYYFAFEIGKDTSKTYSISAEKAIGFSDLTGSAKEIKAGEDEVSVTFTRTIDCEDYYDQFIKIVPEIEARYQFVVNSIGDYRFFDEEGNYVSVSSESIYDADDDAYVGRKLMTDSKLDPEKVYYLALELSENDSDKSYQVTAQSFLRAKKLTIQLKDGALPLISGDTDQGYESSYYDDDTMESVSYFKFSDSAVFGIFNIVAEYKDGTKSTIPYSDVDEYTYDCTTWSVGGDNVLTVTVDGVTATAKVPVTTFEKLYEGVSKLEPEEKTSIEYDKTNGASGAVYFTPEKDGTYYFYSEGFVDVSGRLYEETGKKLSSDEDSRDGVNFLIEYELEAGKKYILATEPYIKTNTKYQIAVSQTKPEAMTYESLEGVDLSSKYINLAFVVDTTGSMSGAIAGVRDNLKEFVTAIAGTKAILRISLIDYKDIEEKEPTVIHYAESGAVWYENEDVEELKEKIGNLEADGGGDTPESAVDALANLVEPDIMSFNSQAAKFAFLVTDADYKDSNNHGIKDMDELAETLEEKGISTSVITEKGYYDTYKDLVTQTSGTLINLNSDFAQAMGMFALKIALETKDYEPDKDIVPVTKISLGDDLTVPVGKIRSFIPTIFPSDATNKKVAWEVKDESIAKISVSEDNKLVVQGISAGETKIYARTLDGGYTASFNFTVTEEYVDKDAKRVETCNIENALTRAKDDDSDLADIVYYADQDGVRTVAEESQKEIYSAIQKNGKNISYIFDDADGNLDYSWKFEGKKISNPDIAVNMEVGVDESKEENKDVFTASGLTTYATADFKHSGSLPGEAEVQLDVGLEAEGTYNLYYLDSSKKELVLEKQNIDVKDGIATFPITHCSTYVIGVAEGTAIPTASPVVSATAAPVVTPAPVVPAATPVPAAQVTQAPAADSATSAPVTTTKKTTGKITAKNKTVKYAKLKKKAQKVTLGAKTNGGKLTYKIKSVTKGQKKKVSVNAKGVVTIKKKCKKGTKITITITSKATSTVTKATKNVTIQVK